MIFQKTAAAGSDVKEISKDNWGYITVSLEHFSC